MPVWLGPRGTLSSSYLCCILTFNSPLFFFFVEGPVQNSARSSLGARKVAPTTDDSFSSVSTLLPGLNKYIFGFRRHASRGA